MLTPPVGVKEHCKPLSVAYEDFVLDLLAEFVSYSITCLNGITVSFFSM